MKVIDHTTVLASNEDVRVIRQQAHLGATGVKVVPIFLLIVRPKVRKMGCSPARPRHFEGQMTQVGRHPTANLQTNLKCRGDTAGNERDAPSGEGRPFFPSLVASLTIIILDLNDYILLGRCSGIILVCWLCISL